MQINIYFMGIISKIIMFTLLIGLSSCGTLKCDKGKFEGEEWSKKESTKTDTV